MTISIIDDEVIAAIGESERAEIIRQVQDDGIQANPLARAIILLFEEVPPKGATHV